MPLLWIKFFNSRSYHECCGVDRGWVKCVAWRKLFAGFDYPVQFNFKPSLSMNTNMTHLKLIFIELLDDTRFYAIPRTVGRWHLHTSQINPSPSPTLGIWILQNFCSNPPSLGQDRDPYIFFFWVVSRASKPDGLLASLQFGSSRQEWRINKRIVHKIMCNFKISYLHFKSSYDLPRTCESWLIQCKKKSSLV